MTALQANQNLRVERLTGGIGRSTISGVTVTIPEELNEFVRAKMHAGEFDTPEAVVVAALTAWQGQEVYGALDGNEVKQRLLEAIDSSRISWNEANFDRIIETLREKHGAS